MKIILLIIGKIITKMLKLANKRATTLPGKIVSNFDKKFPSKFKLKGKVILVTGTNGKTSTANLISQVLESTGKKVINNAKGANMLSGITTLLIQNSNLNFEINADYIVFEVDESSLKSITDLLDANYLIITNFFRDQLDRHFEISQVISKVKEAIKPKTKIIANADDALVYNMLKDLNNKIIYYSMNESKYSTKNEPLVREARYCFECKSVLNYDYFNYGHFGNYHCSNCDFSRPNSKYIIENVNLKNKTFCINSVNYKANSSELYTVYNFAMATALALELKIKIKYIKKTISKFVLNNSRMEKFNIKNKQVTLNIVKNQIGFDATVEAFLRDDKEKTFIYILNNNFADSIDTSWIWDCNYALLNNNKINKFYCLGMRRYELATRIKLENPDFDVEICSKTFECLDKIPTYVGNVYIISAYTAHMQTSDYLKKMEKNNG